MFTKKQHAEISRLNSVINAVSEILANYPNDAALHHSLQLAQNRMQMLQERIYRKKKEDLRLS